MDLGYLRGLSTRTAGRVSLPERGRSAGRFNKEQEALERVANVLYDLAQDQALSSRARQAVAAAATELMWANY